MPTDLRSRKLAKLAVNYSLEIKPKQKVIIKGDIDSIPFLTDLYKEIILKGGYPIVKFNLPNTEDFFFKYAKQHQIGFFPKYWFDTVKSANAYIRVYTEHNTRELTSSNPKKQTQRNSILHPISDYIANESSKIKRLVIAYPCLAHAIESSMSYVEWENFIFDSCLINWAKFSKKLKKINKKFESGKKVELIGKGVNLKFSIENKNSLYDDGKENMPGGEMFMAPVRESIQGEIKFDYPRVYLGKRLSGVYLKFENGKVIDYDADNKEFLKQILNTDENASYIGEFGIGMNHNITRYTNNLLFDEKITGTIHLALGMAYKQNGGGNDSAIHLDIVKDMKQGKIILDDKIIQENGKWKI